MCCAESRRCESSRVVTSPLSNIDGDGYENVTWKVKSRCFKLNRAYSISFNSLKCWLLGINSYRLYRSSGKEKESRCLVITSSTKREIGHLHVVVAQWLQLRNVQKSVMHVKSCCFASLKVILHETIRNDDFKRNTALQHCCDIVLNGCNIVPTLEPCVAL